MIKSRRRKNDGSRLKKRQFMSGMVKQLLCEFYEGLLCEWVVFDFNLYGQGESAIRALNLGKEEFLLG